MATFIKVSSSEAELLRRNRDQVQGSRLQKVEADEQAATGKVITAAVGQQQTAALVGGRRQTRLRRDEPGASILATPGIGLWKTGKTSSDLNLAPGNNEFSGWFGIEFVANRSFAINYLGGFDNLANGFEASLPIRVWRTSGENSPEIAITTELSKGNGGWYAGGYRFIKIAPIRIQKDDVVAIVIFYKSYSQSGLQEDRYQYRTYDEENEAAKTNPNLINGISLAETSEQGDSYPSVNNSIGFLAAVNVNFALGLTSSATPSWAQP